MSIENYFPNYFSFFKILKILTFTFFKKSTIWGTFSKTFYGRYLPFKGVPDRYPATPYIGMCTPHISDSRMFIRSRRDAPRTSETCSRYSQGCFLMILCTGCSFNSFQTPRTSLELDQTAFGHFCSKTCNAQGRFGPRF